MQWSAQFFFGLYIFWLTVLCNFFWLAVILSFHVTFQFQWEQKKPVICLLSLVWTQQYTDECGFIYKNIISRWIAPCRPIATASERTLSLLTHDAAFLTVHTGSPAASWYYYPSSLQRIWLYPEKQCETENECVWTAAGDSGWCRCIVVFLGKPWGWSKGFWMRW